MIYLYLKSIIADARLLCLMPYGSTKPENIERFSDDTPWPFPDHLRRRGPMYIFYDQEPLYGDFNYQLFDHIVEHYQGPFVLVTTEQNSDAVDHIKEKYGWPVVYYFHHVFAAHDWFRGSQFLPQLVSPDQRKLTKKYISFNRITSARRVYRSLLLAELADHNLLDQGYVSYNEVCPEGGHYQDSLTDAVSAGLITSQRATSTMDALNKLTFPLRIDYQDQSIIPNHSFGLSAIPETQESFCYIVTETCFWERKDHLTEKIFKPIISRMPFILAGPAHNLKYLRSYGFKTFSAWFDESYDDIEDADQRLVAIRQTIQEICNYSLDQLSDILADMMPVLEHNYQLFNSSTFLQSCWDELTDNLDAVSLLEPGRI